MKYPFLFILFLLFTPLLFAQTKVSGVVVDENNKPVPYASVAFKGTSEGVIANENGGFYLESKEDRKILHVSFVGYTPKEITLDKAVNYNMTVVLSSSGEELQEV